jgi:hypothetical protein
LAVLRSRSIIHSFALREVYINIRELIFNFNLGKRLMGICSKVDFDHRQSIDGFASTCSTTCLSRHLGKSAVSLLNRV